MPKEIIWGDTPQDEHPDRKIYVPEVRWWKDRDVTLGLVPIQNPEDPGSGLFVEYLTRAQINKLIRTLRRARDQAYGRDE